MDFAVSFPGAPENTGAWVLAVDGDSLLIAHADNTLHWYAMSECKLLRVQTPDAPLLVMPVQPDAQAQPSIVLPGMFDVHRNGF